MGGKDYGGAYKVNDAVIVDRIRGRQAAEEMFALVMDEAHRLSGDIAEDSFHENLLRLLEEARGPKPESSSSPPPMTDEQARFFGKTKLTFGIHAGTPIDECPLDYLIFLTDDNNLRKALRRYLDSPRIKREREADDNY